SRSQRRKGERDRSRIRARARRKKWLGAESKRRHEDFQSSALPTELPSRDGNRLSTMTFCAGCSLCRIPLIGQRKRWRRTSGPSEELVGSTKSRPTSLIIRQIDAANRPPHSEDVNKGRVE